MSQTTSQPRRPYQICTNCVMDTSDEDITFDENGVCMRCNEYKERILPEWNYGSGHEKELISLISEIKKSGTGKTYDCILGWSGGLDSSYMLHLAVKEWRLRPFVFHIDAGWDLPDTTENLKRMTDELGIKLHVETMDWNEMREMQLAWFRTGLESLDVPQDHAFIALTDKLSQELGVKYILNGWNISTEAVADPASWGKGGGPTGDGKFLKDVIRKYCKIPIEKYQFTSGFKHKFWVPYVLGIKTITPLNLVEFTKKEMMETLASGYGYVPYRQKHFEDLITKFLEGWWSPTRFGHDIRRVWLSSLILTNQMTREEALRILAKPPLSEDEGEALFREVAQKLEISEAELQSYHEMPKCTEHFESNVQLHDWGMRIFEVLGIEKRIRK